MQRRQGNKSLSNPMYSETGEIWLKLSSHPSGIQMQRTSNLHVCIP